MVGRFEKLHLPPRFFPYNNALDYTSGHQLHSQMTVNACTCCLMIITSFNNFFSCEKFFLR